MSLDQVLARIRKLLALSRSTNEHEAANAAAQAARLMSEYEIEEAQFRADEPDAKKAEPITEETLLSEGRRLSSWKLNLAAGIARGVGAYVYYQGASIRVYGRRTAIQTTTYMYQFLVLEIARLADEHYEVYGVGVNAKAWKNSFRLGAVQTVASRLSSQRREDFAAHDRDIAASAVNSTALVVVRKDAAEVDAAWKVRARGFVSRQSSGPSSYSAYQRGGQAGASIGLSGGARIGEGPKRIG